MTANARLLDTLLELQLLDRVPRTGYQLRGVSRPETVTEHNWHVAFLVWTLGRDIDGIDLVRALELALVHDLAEVRTGDLPRTAAKYLPAGAKDAAERGALSDLLAPLGTRGVELLAEYQEAKTREARLVKDCDKLQLLIKVAAYESWGEGALGEFWSNPANFPSDTFDSVRSVVSELRRHADPGYERDD